MIRALIATLLAWFALSCAAGEALRGSDVPFAAVAKRDGAPFCSAFAVGPHELLTAAHCVDGADEEDLAIVSRELWEYTARGSAPFVVAHVDAERDLAILRTPLTFRDFLQTRPPTEGELVRAVSAAADWRSSGGRVLPGYGFFRDTDVSIQHGWSGAPVLGADGRAVGVVVRCYGKYFGARHVCARNDMQFSVLP